MARKNFSAEQVIGVLRQIEVETGQGKTLGEACRNAGITDQTYYRWRQSYGGMRVDQAKQLKSLEQENGRLRKAISDLTLDKQILQEVLKGK